MLEQNLEELKIANENVKARRAKNKDKNTVININAQLILLNYLTVKDFEHLKIIINWSKNFRTYSLKKQFLSKNILIFTGQTILLMNGMR